MVNSNPDAYERFARKSRIEEIVEGKTVDIHYDLYLQIMERVKQIMQKKQFVSFGAEASNRELIAAWFFTFILSIRLGIRLDATVRYMEFLTIMELDLEAKEEFEQKFIVISLLGKGSFGSVYEC